VVDNRANVASVQYGESCFRSLPSVCWPCDLRGQSSLEENFARIRNVGKRSGTRMLVYARNLVSPCLPNGRELVQGLFLVIMKAVYVRVGVELFPPFLFFLNQH